MIALRFLSLLLGSRHVPLVWVPGGLDSCSDRLTWKLFLGRTPSFNVKGQPIVNTPREAIQTFLGTGIEYQFLENIRICRPSRVMVDLVQETEKALV
jgi:hypothetical protein